MHKFDGTKALSQIGIWKKLFCSKVARFFRKDTHCSENDYLVHEFFGATFSFWDMVDFVDHKQKIKENQKKFMN